MNKELIMKSDVLDILFENRNKSYGAYNLRKFYGNRLLKATGLMIALTLVLSAFTFLPKNKEFISATPYEIPDTKMSEPKAKEPEKKKDPPKEVVKEIPVSSKKLLSNISIVKNTDKTDSIQTLDPKDLISNINLKVPGDGGPVLIPHIKPDQGGDITGSVKPVSDITTPIANPEVMPSFPGGADALRKFMQRNLHNPKDMEEGEQVSVKVQFVVGFDGKLKSFQLIQDGGEAFNNEVLRVMKKMPDWVPGRANGENVSVYYVIPVKFVPAE